MGRELSVVEAATNGKTARYSDGLPPRSQAHPGSPTGPGKTVMAAARVERLGVPTLWLARRKELID
jgi:hypothetical protein